MLPSLSRVPIGLIVAAEVSMRAALAADFRATHAGYDFDDWGKIVAFEFEHGRAVREIAEQLSEENRP